MRCLITADLHYALKQYDWLLGVAAEFDAVILAGDLLDLSSYVDMRAQAVVVRKYLERLSKTTRLVVCSGNHDLDARDAGGERIAGWFRSLRGMDIAADGDSVEMGDALVTVCPWWDGPQTRRQVGDLLERDEARRRSCWVWIYHAPPAGSPTSWNGKRSFGDEELARWIERYRPDYVFSGHVHTSPFVEGGSWIDRVGSAWVFNAGRDIGEIPAHIVLDTQARNVVWMSSTRGEIADLDRSLPEAVSKLTETPEWLKDADQARRQARP